MANMSPYYLTGFGQTEKVIGLARLLMPLLGDKTGSYGFPLSLVKEFPELGDGDHPWIGVTRFRVDEGDEHRFGGDGKGKSEPEIAREHAAMVGFTLEENPAILAMEGYARWSLPFDCASAISRRCPTMLLELRGRCDIRERWYEVFWMNGDGYYFEVVDLHPYTGEEETHYIREGVTIAPLPDDEWGQDADAVVEPADNIGPNGAPTEKLSLEVGVTECSDAITNEDVINPEGEVIGEEALYKLMVGGKARLSTGADVRP